MSYVLAAAGFAALIDPARKAWGICLAAKSVGMRVERFYLFFRPRSPSFGAGRRSTGSARSRLAAS